MAGQELEIVFLDDKGNVDYSVTATGGKNLWVKEVYIDDSTYHTPVCYGETEPYETRFCDLGELYRFLVKEYGRCISKMYVDLIKDEEDIPESNRVWKPKNRVQQRGWVFQSRVAYDDSPKKYLREVWVTVYKMKPVFETRQVG